MPMALSRKEVVFILRHKSKTSKNRTMSQMFDLEANRIERMDDKEFEAFAKDFVGKQNQTTVTKRTTR